MIGVHAVATVVDLIAVVRILVVKAGVTHVTALHTGTVWAEGTFFVIRDHHPDARNPESARCWCRKPSPGLIIESAIEVAQKHGEYYPPYMGLMVGDRPEDEQCAKGAGLDFQWATEWRAQAMGG